MDSTFYEPFFNYSIFELNNIFSIFVVEKT